jgi:hypothetical protein
VDATLWIYVSWGRPKRFAIHKLIVATRREGHLSHAVSIRETKLARDDARREPRLHFHNGKLAAERRAGKADADQAGADLRVDDMC